MPPKCLVYYSQEVAQARSIKNLAVFMKERALSSNGVGPYPTFRVVVGETNMWLLCAAFCVSLVKNSGWDGAWQSFVLLVMSMSI